MNEAWFFVGIFVFIFIVWIALGGPLRGVPLSIPTRPAVEVATTSTSGGWGSLSLPRAPFTIGTTEIHLPDSGNNGEVGGGDTSLVTPLIKVTGVTFSAVSPYRDTVSLSSYVSNAGSSDATTEYVQLSVASDAAASVDITGWMLKSDATGRTEVIPKGTMVLTSGIVNATSDILLAPGDRAVIVSGRSPVGASFRENKCIGYLENFQEFIPSLPTGCPAAGDELSVRYATHYLQDPDCIDYTDSLSPCEIPARSASTEFTRTCQDFVETYLYYNGCVDAHESDADFDGTVWRIYLGRTATKPLWRERHEVVELLDKSGKTVDAFSY